MPQLQITISGSGTRAEIIVALLAIAENMKDTASLEEQAEKRGIVWEDPILCTTIAAG